MVCTIRCMQYSLNWFSLILAVIYLLRARSYGISYRCTIINNTLSALQFLLSATLLCLLKLWLFKTLTTLERSGVAELVAVTLYKRRRKQIDVLNGCVNIHHTWWGFRYVYSGETQGNNMVCTGVKPSTSSRSYFPNRRLRKLPDGLLGCVNIHHTWWGLRYVYCVYIISQYTSIGRPTHHHNLLKEN